MEGQSGKVRGVIDKSCTRTGSSTGRDHKPENARHVREETGQMSGSERPTTRQATRRGLFYGEPLTPIRAGRCGAWMYGMNGEMGVLYLPTADR